MVDNKGNLITRRAFADTDQMQVLRRVVNKAMSTAYQMTEEVGEYGSGTPSPLHMLCELIRELYEIGQREGWEVCAAQEMARYPLSFLKQLSGEIPAGDAITKINCLLKNASDANYQLRGRDLSELTLGDLKEIAQKVLSAQTIAFELGMMIDAQVERSESSYPGTPIPRERLKVANG